MARQTLKWAFTHEGRRFIPRSNCHVSSNCWKRKSLLNEESWGSQKHIWLHYLPVWILQACVSFILLKRHILVFFQRASSHSSFIDRWNSFHTWFELIWLYPIPSHCIFFKIIIIESQARLGRWRQHNVALFQSTQLAERSRVCAAKLWCSDVIQPSADRFVNIQSSSKMADF